MCSYNWSRSNFFFKFNVKPVTFFSIYNHLVVLYNASVFPMLNTINARCITYDRVCMWMSFVVFLFHSVSNTLVWHSPWIEHKKWIKEHQNNKTKTKMRYAWSMYESMTALLSFDCLFIHVPYMHEWCMLSICVCVWAVCICLNVSMRFEFGTRFTRLLSFFFLPTMMKSKRVDCSIRISFTSKHYTFDSCFTLFT